MGILKFDRNRPYAFVSYKREDKDVVHTDIIELQNRGVNIWFDEDLTAGLNWDDEARPILVDSDCHLVILYASPFALASVNVQKEMLEAIDWGKDILPINFFSRSFKEVYQTEISKVKIFKDPERFSIPGAIDLVGKLSTKRTFISREELTGDNYYNAIIKSINRLAPEIMKESDDTPIQYSTTSHQNPIINPAAQADSAPTQQQDTHPPQQKYEPPPQKNVVAETSQEPVSINADFCPFSFDADFSNVIAIDYKTEKHQVQDNFFVSFIKILCKHHLDDLKALIKVMPLKKIVSSDGNGIYVPELSCNIAVTPNDVVSHLRRLTEMLDIRSDSIRIGYPQSHRHTRSGKENKPKDTGSKNTVSSAPSAGYAFTLFGNNYNEKSQSDAMAKCFETILNRHTSQLDQAISEMGCISERRLSANEIANGTGLSKFRNSKPIIVNGREVFVGTSFGESQTIGLIRKLLRLVGEDDDQFERLAD